MIWKPSNPFCLIIKRLEVGAHDVDIVSIFVKNRVYFRQLTKTNVHFRVELKWTHLIASEQWLSSNLLTSFLLLVWGKWAPFSFLQSMTPFGPEIECNYPFHAWYLIYFMFIVSKLNERIVFPIEIVISKTNNSEWLFVAVALGWLVIGHSKQFLGLE